MNRLLLSERVVFFATLVVLSDGGSNYSLQCVRFDQ